MAFTTILRRSTSCLAPLASRLAGVRRNNYFALFTAVNHTILPPKPSSSSFVPFLHYSLVSKKPSSDESLLRVIESEIQCAIESDDHDRIEEIPSGFPFKIEDNSGEQTITLTRDYQDELIKVEVHMPDLITGENDEDPDIDDDGNQKAIRSSIPLVITISKKSGPCLEFSCIAYPDEIAIDSLAVKYPEHSEDQLAYEGPDFNDLDEGLQKAFHKYLEIRGIKPSTTNFLHEYMINKDSREYLIWMKKLKKFVEA